MKAGLVVASVLLCAGLAPAEASQDQPVQAQPSFRGSTTVVEVDVVVRDKDRRFVADLRAADFEVLEDGVRQEISAVYRVIGPDEPVAPGAGGLPELPTPPPQQIQRILILFFDQAHIEAGGFNRAKQAALTFLKDRFRQGDLGGVLVGGTMAGKRLTSVREELEAAVASAAPAPETSALTRALRQWPRFVDLYEAYRVTRRQPSLQSGTGTALDDVVQRACGEQPTSCRGGGSSMVEAEAENKATQLVSQARMLGKQTLDTVSGLANGLARLPGRKTVIMLTGGFFVEDSWADLGAVIGRAARASVRIYAIDTRGLNRGSAGSDILSAANPAQPQLGGPTLGDTASDGPNSLAVDTGGYVIRNENDFGKAFNEIDKDTSSYYVLGFRTSRPLDGTFHSLDVRVSRPGVTIRARKGYVASAESLSAPLTAAGPPTGPAGAAPSPISGAEKAAAPEAAGVIRLRPDMPETVAGLRPEAAPAAVSSPFPDSLMKRAQEGWSAYQRGAVADAQAALEPAAVHPSAPPWVVYVLGWAQYAQAKPADAAVSWERVRAAVPGFSAVYFDLADAYLTQREFGRAIETLRAAESRWPRDVEVYNALGVIQLARGALDDAIASFEKAAGVAPADATAAYNLARSCELRFIRASRQRRAGSGSVALGPVFQDRDRAVEFYRRVIALGGPFAGQAAEGLKRLNAQ